MVAEITADYLNHHLKTEATTTDSNAFAATS